MSMQNSRKANTLIATVTLAAVILAAGPTLAQGSGGKWSRGAAPGGHGCDTMEFRMERMAARLDLTDEQVEAITGIREGGQKQILEMRKEMMRLRNELQGELLEDEPSEGEVVSLTEKIGDLRTRMQVDRAKNRLAVVKLLTPEQRDKMLVMGHGGKGRFGGGRGMGHQPGPGHRSGGRQGRAACRI